jgi:hypothetical protein
VSVSGENDGPFPPFENGGNGDERDERDERGRFKRGWSGGPGRPAASDRLRALRETLADTLKPSDIKRAVATLRRLLKEGRPQEQLQAARELLDRGTGKATPAEWTDDSSEPEFDSKVG